MTKPKPVQTWKVKLEKRIVGEIQQTGLGFQYIPKGSKTGGEVFPSFHLCKLSLGPETVVDS